VWNARIAKRGIAILTSTRGIGTTKLPHCDNQQPTSGFQGALRYTMAPWCLQVRDWSPSVPLSWKTRAPDEPIKKLVGTRGATRKCTATRSATSETAGSMSCHDHHRKPIPRTRFPLHAGWRQAHNAHIAKTPPEALPRCLYIACVQDPHESSSEKSSTSFYRIVARGCCARQSLISKSPRRFNSAKEGTNQIGRR
jgi:hypothetical protein